MSAQLIADVGGTNARFALVDAAGTQTAVQTFRNRAFDSFDAMLAAYLETAGVTPEVAAIAVAGPVVDSAVTMTNLGWRIAADSLQRHFALSRVSVINDFAAQAWATLALGPDDTRALAAGSAVATANRAVLGPGTGLGVSGLVSHGEDWVVVAGEGGHVSLCGMTERERALVAWATQRYGHCSAERLLSGPGLALIHEFCSGAVADPAAVTAGARQSEPRATEAVELFCGLLGGVAGNLALTYGARGGVFLSGGILPAIADLLERSPFMQRFRAKGRFRDYLDAIPVHLVTAADPGLLGLAEYLRRTGRPG